MIWVTACKVHGYRHESREVEGRPAAADFRTLVDGQDPLVDSQPATCSDCGEPLIVARSPKSVSAARNGTHVVTHDPTALQAAAPEPSPSANVEVLFSVNQGEDVKEMRETPSGLVIITTRRVVRLTL